MTEVTDHRLALVERAIDTHGAYLLHYLTQLTRNPHDAGELFNDLWMVVLRRFKDGDIGNLSFLRRKAYQIFVDWYRKERRNPVAAMETPPEIAAPPGQGDVLSAEEEEGFKIRFFEEYPVALSPEQKEALWLHARLGMTFVEIAAMLDKPPSTVGDWIKQARTAFAEYLNNE